MKRLFKILFLFPVLYAVSCSDDDCKGTFEFTPMAIEIKVTDAENNDRLDPYDIYIVYKGKEYTYAPLEEDEVDYGLRIRLGRLWDANPDRTLLTFGDFSANGGHKDEKLTIHYGDGTTDEIKFDLYITWDGCDATEHFNLYRNGVKTDLPIRKVVD